MKKVGIISEFNPFHNGHKYLLDTAREICKADLVITIMSGDVVQRGELSLIDKYARADCAMESADIVIEMPSFITLQSANMFALKNIEILNKLKIDYLAFGIEYVDEKDFIDISSLILAKDSLIDNNIRKLVKSGLSYPRASYLATKEIIGNDKFLSSNNILAVEYLRAIKKVNPSIKAIPIRRIGALNKDENFGNKNFSSSTAIRKNIANNKITSYVPKTSYRKINEFIKEYKSFADKNLIYNMFRYKILIEKKQMSDILCFEDGMDNLLKKASEKHTGFNDFINDVATKRFTKARIKRLILNFLLDNKNKLNDLDINFIKILAFNKKATFLLKDKSLTYVIQKKDSYNLKTSDKFIYKKIIDASNLFSLAIGRDINYDFTKIIQIKESSL